MSSASRRRKSPSKRPQRGFLDVAEGKYIIKLYHEAGHSVFIDDLRHRYSSLSYLSIWPSMSSEIDKAFVDAIDTGSATKLGEIIHIIAMAKQLKLKTSPRAWKPPRRRSF